MAGIFSTKNVKDAEAALEKEKTEAAAAAAAAEKALEEEVAAAKALEEAKAAEAPVAEDKPLSKAMPLGTKAHFQTVLGYPFWHPYQNKRVGNTREEGVELEVDSWVNAQLEAGFIISFTPAE